MKKLKKGLLTVLILTLFSSNVVYASPPSKPSGDNMGKPGAGNSSNSSVSYIGNSTISSDTSSEKESYSSDTGKENALLVSGGNSTLTNPTITKTGDDSGDNSDFYGTNAAVLAYNGAKLNISGGTVTTNGSHANAVFAYGTGSINITDTVIKTTSNNSGALMVTGGGTLVATNVTAETDGNSSAPIRSDRGGGTLTVKGGTYTSHGTGSPVIYSTADINVSDATLTATASEGVVVEGKNSVTLDNVNMEVTNTKLNGNSETYKSIFIYQSMSGDAEVGTSSFTASNSKIVNNKGEIIFVTNTNTVINLENNEIINNDEEGSFLKIGSAKWGNSGSNGGNVELNLTNQVVTGDIIVDDISTLDMNLKSGSVYKGSIDNNNTAKEINLTLDSDSYIVLASDSYVDSLNNSDTTNSNIYLNGYKLYVNGEEVSGNDKEFDQNLIDSTTKATSNKVEDKNINNKNNIMIIAFTSACVVVGISLVTTILVKKKKSNK